MTKMIVIKMMPLKSGRRNGLIEMIFGNMCGTVIEKVLMRRLRYYVRNLVTKMRRFRLHH